MVPERHFMNLAICAIFRNEALYLREWIEFHRLVGVDRFFLYNNRSEDDYHRVLDTYIAAGVVVLTEWPHFPPCQVEAYQHYIDTQPRVADWTAFLDIDEFLWSPRFKTIPEALDSLPQHSGAVGVNWMCFGSSSHKEWHDAPVIERFTWRPHAGIPSNHYIKSIVRMDQHFVIADPHCAQVPTYSPSGKLILGSHCADHEHDLLRINHYGSKSRQEWVTRQRLGKPCSNSAPSPERCYEEIQARDVEDCEIQRYLPQLKERLALG
jgi:hypothetical protein